MASVDEGGAIRLERRFRAPVERVFRAWREPRELERWAWGSMGADVRADVDFRVGGRFVVSTLRPDGTRWSFSGTYTDVQAIRRLAHTLAWDAPMGYDPVPESVTVDFVGRERETTVVFRHEGDLGPAARREHARGWFDVLETLERHLEDERGRPPERRDERRSAGGSVG